MSELQTTKRMPRRDILKATACLAFGALAAPGAAFFAYRGSQGAFPKRIPSSRTKNPNVLLIVLDTVRADHLSCYGYHRQTTPHIDEFAKSARLYRNVLSPSIWTLPSHASLFTGLPASVHGANWPDPYLRPQFDSLPAQLRNLGYQTVGLSCNGGFINARRGFDRGFDLFWNPKDRAKGFSHLLARELGVRREHDDFWSSATSMHRRLGKWFAEDYRPDRPFFIFMNYIEAHYPYVPPIPAPVWSTPAAWRNRGSVPVGKMMEYSFAGSNPLTQKEIVEMQTLYDEEIVYLDRKIQELLVFLRSSGLDESTLIILTSDHGEHFGEHHQLEHWLWVYEPLVRVPLIVRNPGHFPPGIESRLVQSHDIYPTILKLAGSSWEPKPAHNCRSLLEQERPEPRFGVTEMLMPWLDPIVEMQHRFPEIDILRLAEPVRAVQVGEEKLIMYSDGRTELFHIAMDPGETKNLAGEKPETVRTLAGRLSDWLGSFDHYRHMPGPPANNMKITSREMKALKALGYIR
jgi:arylsulfatase A-like enzyme